MSITEPTLTRRGFVKAGGALFVTAVVLPDLLSLDGTSVEAATLDATNLDAWLEIRDDGTVLVRTGRGEMGVHMSGYYRQMVAEELCIQPDMVELITADTDRTPDGGWSADFMSGAQNLRKVAAYTYQALLGLAAAHLGTSASSLAVTNGVVTAGRSPAASSVTYTELVRGQRLELTIPVSGELPSMNDEGTAIMNATGITVTGTPPMKPLSQYTVVGQSFPSPSVAEKVTAQTTWVGDVRLPGMLHARMVRPSTLGSTLIAVGPLDKERFQTADVVTKGNLVAVVSPNEWEAVSAARAVAAGTQWTEWAGLPTSDRLAEAIRAGKQPGRERGDQAAADAAFSAAAKVVHCTYSQPYVKHAPIGPFVAVADVQADGATTVYTHSAQSQGLRAHLSHVLSVDLEKVTVRFLEGSGQYGRTSLGGDGAEADAAILSQMLGRPVRVQWSLQEDLAWSSQSQGWAADLRAGLDEAGKLLVIQSDFINTPGFDIRTAGAVLAGLPDLPSPPPSGGPAGFGAGAAFYDIPVEFHRGYGAPIHTGTVPSGVGLRGNIMRTPGQRQNVCALESLMNEAAAGAGADPIQFRLDHTQDRRLIDIVRKTAEAAGWEARPSPGPGARRVGDAPVSGRGMAVIYRFGSYWAGIAEIDVVPSTGVITVTRFTLGIDPGKVVNPRHLTRVIEGGVVMGLGEALMEELAFDKGKITSTDWRTYKIPTMRDTPEIQIVTISRDDAGFGGGGEAANALPQPALLAAVFDATGVQPRRTPLTPAYVKELLATADTPTRS